MQPPHPPAGGATLPAQARKGFRQPKASRKQPGAAGIAEGTTGPAEAEMAVVVALFQHRRLSDAEAHARSLTVRFPSHGFGWKALGAILLEQGRQYEALAAQRQAVALLPGDAETHNNLGNGYLACCDLPAAEASYRRALAVVPGYAEAHNNLGICLARQGRLPEAEASYRHALRSHPHYAQALSNLGNTLQALGRTDEAETSHRQAIAAMPQYAEAHYNLGNTLMQSGRLTEAEASYRRAIDLRPQYAEALCNLGVVLQQQGRHAESEAVYRHTIAIHPRYTEAHNNLGHCLSELGRHADAETSCRRAIEIDPGHAAAHNNLGNALHLHTWYAAAEQSYRQAVALNPHYAEAHSNLGNTLLHQGRVAEAIPCYRRAIALKPDYCDAQSNLLFALAHDESATAASLFAEHLRYAHQLEAPLRHLWSAHTNALDPDRPLHIGFVSGDLRYHPVARFAEPMLQHLAQDRSLSLHAYYNYATEDAVTARLRPHFAAWHPCASLSNAALAEAIRADGIDILLDLTGHTAHNRLPALARKPAPVQTSWLGFPGTTGMQSVDYFLCDRAALPPEQFAPCFREKIAYLPINASFLPTPEAPAVNPLPALTAGHLTFGSFNRMVKLSPSVVALWSQLLRALPDSCMLLGGMPSDGGADRLKDWFAAEGIATGRLSFHGTRSVEEDMALHHRIDLCLDTFPYNGSTTTHNALWMGVPTLTLTGPTMTGRMGTSILIHAGLQDFIATDPGDFVRRGLEWSRNLAALAAVRAGLRERCSHSLLGRHQAAAAAMSRALRTMWRRHCSGLAPQSFDVT